MSTETKRSKPQQVKPPVTAGDPEREREHWEAAGKIIEDLWIFEAERAEV